MTQNNIEFKTLTGKDPDLKDYIPALARLRFSSKILRWVEEAASLILVPSCTDTLAGYHRVRIGCQARALENQVYVVQSALLGKCAWSDMIDENTGAAGIYGPVDKGFPAGGCIAEGSVD